MTPRYDRLRIAVWAVILAVCLVTAYASDGLRHRCAARLGWRDYHSANLVVCPGAHGRPDSAGRAGDAGHCRQGDHGGVGDGRRVPVPRSHFAHLGAGSSPSGAAGSCDPLPQAGRLRGQAVRQLWRVGRWQRSMEASIWLTDWMPDERISKPTKPIATAGRIVTVNPGQFERQVRVVIDAHGLPYPVPVEVAR